MDILYNFFEKHYPWIFSGIGVAAIAGFLGIFIRLLRKKNQNQYQKIGNNSTGIQVGGDYSINIQSEKSNKDKR